MKGNRIFRGVKGVSIFVKKNFFDFIAALNYRKFPPKKKIHFFVNLGVGFFIAVLCHLMQTTNLGERIINSVGDLYTRREAKEALETPGIMGKAKIVFVDIDHQKYVDWGEPDITPRDKLAEMVKKCYDAGAKVILLDFFFEKEDRTPANDEKLINVLKDIREKERSKRNGNKEGSEQNNPFSGIIFCKRIGFKKDLKENIFYDFFHKKNREDQKDNIFFQAVPSVSSNIYDDVVRYWNSYKKYKDKKGNTAVIWGVPFLAYMLYNKQAQWMGYFEGKILAKNQVDIDHQIEEFEFDGNDYILSNYDSHPYFQRIRFQMIPGIEKVDDLKKFRPEDEGNVYLIRVKYGNNFEYIGDAFFKNKIVVIGNSSPDIDDMHRTPLGDMPGMYVLGNAINTILNTKQVKPPPAWLEYLIEIIVIVAAAYLFLYLTSFLALLIAVIVTLFGLVEFGYLHYVKTGELLSSGFVIIGMVFHKITADIEETFRKKGRLKHSE